MGLADTANLVVKLSLEGNFAGGIANAERQLSIFSGTAGTKLTGALSHAGSQLKGLITGPLGLLGLGAGLLGVGGALKATLERMNDLAFGTEKLQALTGGTAQNISVLLAATDKYGISIDGLTTSAAFYEKNVNKVIATHADLAKVLTDATGKALPFDQAILAIADDYAKSTDKAKAAADAAAVFGRSYATLVPVLDLGKQGILDLETEAAKMGLQLSQANVADFAKYRDGLRKFQESIAGLEVGIGEQLLPVITELANGLSTFVAAHKDDIVNFVHGAVDAAKSAAGVIGGLASKVGTFWNSIPPAFRDLLVKGIVADKTISFLFGFDPAKMILGGLGGQFFSRGSSPANPMFVSGGGLGAGGAVGGLLDVVQKVFLVGILASVADDIQGALGSKYDPAKNLPLDQLSWPFGPKNTPKVDFGPWTNIFGGDSSSTPSPDTHIPGGAGGGFTAATPIGRNPDHMIVTAPDLTADMRENNRILRQTGQVEAAGLSRIASAIARFGYTPAQWAAIYERAAKAGGSSQINALARTHKSLDAIALADSETSKFLTGKAGPFFQDGKNQTRLLASLESRQKYFQAHGDTVTAAALGRDIAALKNKPNIVNVTVPVNMYVTVRDYVRQQTIASHYGTTFGGRVVSKNGTYS